MSVDTTEPGRASAISRWWRDLGSVRVRRALLVILALGALLRVAWVAHAGVKPHFVSDPEAYLLQGEQIAHGHGYTNPFVESYYNVDRAFHQKPMWPDQASSFYPPGYPTFIAGVAWVVWHTPIPDGDGAIVRTVCFVQAFLGVLSILLLYELGRRVAGTRVALVAALLFALYPGLITLTATLQLETVFIALTLATMLVVLPVATADEPRRGRLVVAGAMIGAVTLVRPTIALLIVAFVATRFVARRPWRKTVVATLVLVTATVAVVAPWTIRNALALHSFVPLSTGVGSALCMARNPDASGHIDSKVLADRCVPPTEDRTPAEQDVATNTYATRQAVKWVVHHPLDEVRMWFWRSFYAYQKDTTGIDDFSSSMDPHWRDVVTMLSDSASFVVLALAGVGGIVLAITRRRGAVFLLAATLLFAAVPIMLFGDPRYRMPAEPLFILLAAVTVGLVADAIARERGQAVERPSSLDLVSSAQHG